MKLGLPRRATALTASVTSALAMIVIGATSADATTPPWETAANTNRVGTLTLYNAAGAVITNGSTNTAPFAAYAVGSDTIRAGDVQAETVFANPDPASDPALWFNIASGNFAAYPLSTGPANVKTLSQTHPVATGGAGDATIDDFEGVATHSSQPGYQNVIHIRLITANSSNQQTTKYDDADLLIDPVAHTWTQIYPTAASVPSAPAAPTAVAHAASAAVSWVAPADGGAPITGYNVEYSSDGGTTWSTPVVFGTAATTETVSGLSNGTSYVFRVAATNVAGTGAYSPQSVSAVIPIADTTTLTLTAPSPTKYGTTATVAAKLTDTTGTAHGFVGSVSLYRRATSTSAWTLVKTLGTASTGVANVSFKFTANVQLYYKFAGNSLHKAVNSAIKSVSVAQVIVIHATPTTLIHGHATKIYGTVSPAGTGQVVTLQQLVGTTWKTIATQTLAKRLLPNKVTTVGFLFSRTLSTKGTFKFRVIKAKTTTLAAGTSATVTIKAT